MSMKRVHTSKGRPMVANLSPDRAGRKAGCRHAKSYVVQLCSEQYSDLDISTQPHRRYRPDKPPTMERNRPRETRRVELCRQLWEANWESSSGGSMDSLGSMDRLEHTAPGGKQPQGLDNDKGVSHGIGVSPDRGVAGGDGSGDSSPINGDNSPGAVGRKLDKQLVQLQNLVRSLENLELEIISQHGGGDEDENQEEAGSECRQDNISTAVSTFDSPQDTCSRARKAPPAQSPRVSTLSRKYQRSKRSGDSDNIL